MPPSLRQISITSSLNLLWSFTLQVTLDPVYRWPVLRLKAALNCGPSAPEAGLFKELLCWASSLHTAIRLNQQPNASPSYVSSNNRDLQQCVPDLEYHSDLPSSQFGQVALIKSGVFSFFGQMYLFNIWRPMGNLDSSSGCSHHLRRPTGNNQRLEANVEWYSDVVRGKCSLSSCFPQICENSE